MIEKVFTIESIKSNFDHILCSYPEYEKDWLEMKQTILEWYVKILNHAEELAESADRSEIGAFSDWCEIRACNLLASWHIKLGINNYRILNVLPQAAFYDLMSELEEHVPNLDVYKILGYDRLPDNWWLPNQVEPDI